MGFDTSNANNLRNDTGEELLRVVMGFEEDRLLALNHSLRIAVTETNMEFITNASTMLDGVGSSGVRVKAWKNLGDIVVESKGFQVPNAQQVE